MRAGRRFTKTILIVQALFLVPSLFSSPVMGGGARAFRGGPYDQPALSRSRGGESGQNERLRSVMIPLIQAMDHPCSADEVRIGIINQSEINAGNAGGCQFLVTAGLLRQATDDQLRGVLDSYSHRA